MSERVIQFRVGVMVLATAIIAGILIVLFGDLPSLVQSTYPPVDTNLLHLLSIISKARKYSSKIYAVIPYMGYARQDREFLDGEVVSISVIGKLLRSVGAKKIITVDIHSKMALRKLKIISENVTVISELVRFFKKKKLKNPLVVSPDLGGKERAEKFAKLNRKYL